MPHRCAKARPTRPLPARERRYFLGSKLSRLSGRLLTGWALVRTQPIPRFLTNVSVQENDVAFVKALALSKGELCPCSVMVNAPVSLTGNRGSIPLTDTTRPGSPVALPVARQPLLSDMSVTVLAHRATGEACYGSV